MDRAVRTLIACVCEGETLVATHDAGVGMTGLLIVSGGSEIRCGSHRGMAMLAARLAAQGVPVFRYDRRGVGDSSGADGGFLDSRADMVAAAAAFRAAAPRVDRIVGFGNCDAASALALFGRDAGLDAVILANPWIVEPTDDLPPVAAIRARYAERLRDPATWGRMLRGGVDIAKLFSGLTKLVRTTREAGSLATRVLAAIEAWGADATVLLAEHDATALAFSAEYRGEAARIDSDSHSFAGVGDAAWLEGQILAAMHLERR